MSNPDPMLADPWQQFPESAPYTAIEYPSVGATYSRDEFGVYRYDTYGRGTVLEGQERRSWLGGYPTEAEAKAEHPGAEPTGGSQFRELVIPKEPPPWFDPADAGESWDGE